LVRFAPLGIGTPHKNRLIDPTATSVLARSHGADPGLACGREMLPADLTLRADRVAGMHQLVRVAQSPRVPHPEVELDRVAPRVGAHG